MNEYVLLSDTGTAKVYHLPQGDTIYMTRCGLLLGMHMKRVHAEAELRLCKRCATNPTDEEGPRNDQ